jgi:hypothetical protein
MAFKIEYDYGDGELGDYDIADGAVQDFNSYANISALESNTVTINLETQIEGRYEKFHAGADILLHVSSTNRTNPEHLGKYLIAKITIANNGVLTLDKNVEEFFKGVDLDFEHLQAVTIPNFDCLTLGKGAVITAPPYNPFNHLGGILIIRCWRNFIFKGGNIDLTNCGIPYNRKNSLRPLTEQESAANGENDKAKFAGQENFITAERFLLNAGDGACLIIAKNLICDENSRIGNPATHGAAYCRGAKDSVGVKPSNITNIGGSSILILADKIDNFTPKIIAKYRSTDKPEGRGLCRCHIASNFELPADEGLYSFDVLSDKSRVQKMGVEDFGNGSFGDYVNPTLSFNNYAKVTSISQKGYRLTITGKTLNGLAPMRVGGLVLAVATQKTDKEVAEAGKFTLARVLSAAKDAVTLSKPAPVVDLNSYTLQLISMPEFTNLTISTNYNYTRKFENGLGGICAFAVSGKCDLSGGAINLEGKGGAIAYGRAGLKYLGNAQMRNRLPIGAGHGTAFILANELVLNENTRIGGTYSGKGEGNRFGGNNVDGTNAGGGYVGGEDENGTGSGGGYMGGGGAGGVGGSGASGGTSTKEYDATRIVGGYGGANGKGGQAGLAGASVMIIAEKITGFTQAAISTGGSGALGAQNGAAGFGGGGNATSGGGAGGFAFIFANGTD